jgi:hypothetical protein
MTAKLRQASLYLRIADKAEMVDDIDTAELYRAKANSLIIRDNAERNAWQAGKVIWLDEM